MPVETKQQCDNCGVSILSQTYTRNKGLCAPCVKENDRDSILAGTELSVPRFGFDVRIQSKNLSCYLYCVTRGDTRPIAERQALILAERRLLELFAPKVTEANLSIATASEFSSTEKFTKYSEIRSDDFIAEPRGEPFKIPQRPDLSRIEESLFQLASQAIAEFFGKKDSKFYAFGFDCNAAYGGLLLCANTEKDFQRTSEYYTTEWNYSPSRLKELKRNFGDWRYQGFNLDYSFWEESWKPIETSVVNYVFSDCIEDEIVRDFVEKMMESFTAVLLRLESEGVLAIIGKEPGFYLQVHDHDEDPAVGDERIQRVRNRKKA